MCFLSSAKLTLFYALPAQGFRLIKKNLWPWVILSSLLQASQLPMDLLNLNFAVLSKNETQRVTSSSKQEGSESEEDIAVVR